MKFFYSIMSAIWLVVIALNCLDRVELGIFGAILCCGDTLFLRFLFILSTGKYGVKKELQVMNAYSILASIALGLNMQSSAYWIVQSAIPVVSITAISVCTFLMFFLTNKTHINLENSDEI